MVPGGTMSYVDRGEGEPIVMVHGNPYWSVEYRGLRAARFAEAEHFVAEEAPDELTREMEMILR